MLRSKRVTLVLSAGLLVACLFAAIALEAANTTTPLKFRGICYSPFRTGQTPAGGPYPTTKQIGEDLKLLKGVTFNILTFSCKDTLGQIPKMAGAQKLTVILGIWLGRDLAENQAEIARGIKAAKNASVAGVMVGSEVLLRDDLTESQLIEYINQVKSQVKAPVGAAETWSNWLNHPNLAAAADFLLVNIYPYWESQPIAVAAAYVISRYQQVADANPGKAAIIGETGWPTAGETQGPAVPGEAQQVQFLRDFVPMALEQDIPFFLFSAFDEPWKTPATGKEVESHWGIFTVNRTLKPEVAALIAAPPYGVDIRAALNAGARAWSKIALAGYAYGADQAKHRIVAYCKTDHWYVQPFRNKPFTSIAKGGNWSSKTHLGDIYGALLVTNDYLPDDQIYVQDLSQLVDGVKVMAASERLAKDYLSPPLPRLFGGK